MPPLQARKTSAYVIKCLLHFVQPPGTRLLIVDNGAFLLNPISHDHWYINGAFDALRASEWITAPVAVGANVAECFLTPAGREMAAAIESAKRGYTQLTLEEILAELETTITVQIEEQTAGRQEEFNPIMPL